MNKLLFASSLLVLASAPAYAATTAGSASATVVSPLTLTHTVGRSIKFGAFVAAAGTVTVNADGTNSSSGVALLSGSATASDAFSIAGDAGRVATISTTSSTVTNGTSTMNFTTDASSSSVTLTGGTANFTVGGTLTVAAATSAGVYTGTYNATVNYE